MDSLLNQFIIACIEGNLELVKFLIKNTNLNVNRKNKYQYTVFHYACQEGNLEIVEFFKGLEVWFWSYRKGSRNMLYNTSYCKAYSILET